MFRRKHEAAVINTKQLAILHHNQRLGYPTTKHMKPQFIKFTIILAQINLLRSTPIASESETTWDFSGAASLLRSASPSSLENAMDNVSEISGQV
ncbi:hypothetical protein K1719_009434 [Acacia pycnantha]|nr:hypothetical protein K1719_009434 [Acacia pycnantha]